MPFLENSDDNNNEGWQQCIGLLKHLIEILTMSDDSKNSFFRVFWSYFYYISFNIVSISS